jgi:hypothetical protein
MLIVGTEQSLILEYFSRSLPFMILGDETVIDQLKLPRKRREKSTFPQITRFDAEQHRLNPLAGITHRGAKDFISTINAIYPEGENTLTRKNSNYVLLKALLDQPDLLDTLIAPSEDPAIKDAYQKIDALLMSPILKTVLLEPTNFSFKGILIVRLDPAELGEEECFALGQFLIGQYQRHSQGQIIIPDYGLYAALHHTQLIRQGRLVACVNYLDEMPPKIKKLMLLGDKVPARCTYDDAVVLADYARIPKGTTGYTDFLDRAIKGD